MKVLEKIAVSVLILFVLTLIVYLGADIFLRYLELNMYYNSEVNHECNQSYI